MQAIKGFTDEELDALTAKAGVTPYHVARFLEVLVSSTDTGLAMVRRWQDELGREGDPTDDRQTNV